VKETRGIQRATRNQNCSLLGIAVQIQIRNKRRILMTKRRTLLNTIVLLTFSGLLMAAQMDMPANKPKTSSAAPGTLTGIISDSMCGAQHMEKGKTAAECTRECAKGGTKYGLVVGKKVYMLEGHEAELDKLAGAKATVRGSVKGEMITVDSVSAAKKGSM
jgi:hypothetical protein